MAYSTWWLAFFNVFTFHAWGSGILGGGVEMNPGRLRPGFVYGRFNRAVEADSSKSTNYFTQLPAYKRTGYAAKIGYGTEENHIDFIYLHARDDSNSIRRPDAAYNITPAENAVLGISFKYKLFKHIIIESDVAGSLYTRDQRADTFSNELLKDAKLLTKLIARVNTGTLRYEDAGARKGNTYYYYLQPEDGRNTVADVTSNKVYIAY